MVKYVRKIYTSGYLDALFETHIAKILGICGREEQYSQEY